MAQTLDRFAYRTSVEISPDADLGGDSSAGTSSRSVLNTLSWLIPISVLQNVRHGRRLTSVPYQTHGEMFTGGPLAKAFAVVSENGGGGSAGGKNIGCEDGLRCVFWYIRQNFARWACLFSLSGVALLAFIGILNWAAACTAAWRHDGIARWWRQRFPVT